MTNDMLSSMIENEKNSLCLQEDNKNAINVYTHATGQPQIPLVYLKMHSTQNLINFRTYIAIE